MYTRSDTSGTSKGKCWTPTCGVLLPFIALRKTSSTKNHMTRQLEQIYLGFIYRAHLLLLWLRRLCESRVGLGFHCFDLHNLNLIVYCQRNFGWHLQRSEGQRWQPTGMVFFGVSFLLVAEHPFTLLMSTLMFKYVACNHEWNTIINKNQKTVNFAFQCFSSKPWHHSMVVHNRKFTNNVTKTNQL